MNNFFTKTVFTLALCCFPLLGLSLFSVMFNEDTGNFEAFVFYKNLTPDYCDYWDQVNYASLYGIGSYEKIAIPTTAEQFICFKHDSIFYGPFKGSHCEAFIIDNKVYMSNQNCTCTNKNGGDACPPLPPANICTENCSHS